MSKLLLLSPPHLCVARRTFFHGGLLTSSVIENWYNRSRKSEAKYRGADYACADWLLACGAPLCRFDDRVDVRSKTQLKRLFSKHGLLSTQSPRLTHVDASDSVIHKYGVANLANTPFLHSMVLNHCEHLDDDALLLLVRLKKDSLRHLEMTYHSVAISDFGVQRLMQLSSLKRLHLYMLMGVERRDIVLGTLRAHLPKCEITFPESSSFGYHREKGERDGWTRRGTRTALTPERHGLL